jgi:hypothetical protein
LLIVKGKQLIFILNTFSLSLAYILALTGREGKGGGIKRLKVKFKY